MEQDTGKFRKNMKDQYYTKSSVATKCIELIRGSISESESYQWIEPSAGNGVFLKGLPNTFDKIGIDLEPKSTGIQQGNFLEWSPQSAELRHNVPLKRSTLGSNSVSISNTGSSISQKKRIFFGNPPFGRQGSLAKSFIKHASQYADVIAFILPRSFVKPSMSRAFPLKFHCIHSEEIEKNAFEVNKVDYDVPCVFQIWIKKPTDRILADPIKEVGFTYVKHGQAFHIAFKRVGGLAGKCYPSSPTSTADYNGQYHYFLKLEDIYTPYVKNIIDKVNGHVFPSNTVGMRSLSKSEANEVLNRVLEGYS